MERKKIARLMMLLMISMILWVVTAPVISSRLLVAL